MLRTIAPSSWFHLNTFRLGNEKDEPPPPSSCAAFSIRYLAGNTCSAVPGGIFLLRKHTAFAVTLTRNIRKLILSKKYMPCQKGGWRFGCFYPASSVPSLAMLSFRGLSVFVWPSCVHSLHCLRSCYTPIILDDFIKEKALRRTFWSQSLSLGVHKDRTYFRYCNHQEDTTTLKVAKVEKNLKITKWILVQKNLWECINNLWESSEVIALTEQEMLYRK